LVLEETPAAALALPEEILPSFMVQRQLQARAAKVATVSLWQAEQAPVAT
jgi:hypothetical protein